MQDELGNEIRTGQADPADDWPVLNREQVRRRTASRLFFAIFLITVGTLLFLGNVGILPVHDVWDYWPLVFVAIGFAKLLNCRNTSAAARIVPILLIVFGSLFLLVSLGIFHINAHDDSWPISMLLIAFGIVALGKVLDPNASKRPAVGFSKNVWRSSSDSLLKDSAIFGELKRKIDTANFEGGAVHSVFGNVDLNLRRAQISPVDKFVTVDANAVFGSVKIRVPENWRIDIKGVAVLGSYTDKTMPPATPDWQTPVLTITGYSVFGSVEIDN